MADEMTLGDLARAIDGTQRILTVRWSRKHAWQAQLREGPLAQQSSGATLEDALRLLLTSIGGAP